VLVEKAVEDIAATAQRLARRLADHLRTSGITALLIKLEKIPLGPNRPSEHISEQRLSLRPPEPGYADLAAAEANTPADAAAAGDGARKARPKGLYLVGGAAEAAAASKSLWLERAKPAAMAGSGAASAAGYAAQAGGTESGSQFPLRRGAGPPMRDLRSSAEGGPCPAPQEGSAASVLSVAADSIPEHLRVSGVTGARAQTFGFADLGSRGGGDGNEQDGPRDASADGDEPGVTSSFFGFGLPSDGQGGGPAAAGVFGGYVTGAVDAYDTNINALDAGVDGGATVADADTEMALWEAMVKEMSAGTSETGAAEEQGEDDAGEQGEDEWEDA
jgi:hypothetical protein